MRKICPINPHGTGFCKGNNCMLFRPEVRNGVDGKPSEEGECVFTEIADHLQDIGSTLYSGISVYEGDGNHD